MLQLHKNPLGATLRGLPFYLFAVGGAVVVVTWLLLMQVVWTGPAPYSRPPTPECPSVPSKP